MANTSCAVYFRKKEVWKFFKDIENEPRPYMQCSRLYNRILAQRKVFRMSISDNGAGVVGLMQWCRGHACGLHSPLNVPTLRH